MSEDERMLLREMVASLDDAAAGLMARGVPWPAYRGLVEAGDRLMDRVLS